MAANSLSETSGGPVDTEIDIVGRGAGDQSPPGSQIDGNLHDLVVGATPWSVDIEEFQGDRFDLCRLRTKRGGHSSFDVFAQGV